MNIRTVLERNGYRRKGERYLPPDSKTKVAGVRILTGEDGIERAFSDHGSCPLNDEHAHDSFSALILLEHAGNVTAAVKAAAQELGMERPAPTAPDSIKFDWTVEMVRARWEAFETDIQRHGGELLDHMQGHVHVRNALIELWMTLTHIAPTHIKQWQDKWVLDFGGLTRLKAYGVTGVNADITGRLRQLDTLGFFLSIIKVNPQDRSSPIYLEITPDPLDLPVMKLTKEASKSFTVRARDKPPAKTKVSLTLTSTKKALPKGTGKGEAYFELSAARLTVLHMACLPSCTVEMLAELRGKKPQAIRRQIRQLERAGIVLRKGHALTLTMTWEAFLAHLRLEREGDEHVRSKVLRALEHSEVFARRRLFGKGARHVGPRELAKRRVAWNVLRQRVERVRAGESLSEVLGLAA